MILKAALVAKIVVMSLMAAVLTGVLIFGLTSGFGLEPFIRRDTADAAFTEVYEYTADAEDMDSLEIQWGDGSVALRYYEGSVIRITESARERLKENDKLRLETSGSTVKISWNDKAWTRLIPFFEKSKRLLVELPAGMALDEVHISAANAGVDVADMNGEQFRIETASGEIKAENLRAEEIRLQNVSGGITGENLLAGELELEGVSGSVTALNAVADRLKAKSVSGNLHITGSFQELKCESVSGSVQAESGLLPENAEINTISGHTALGLPENPGFALEYSSISGELEKTDFPIEKDGKQSYYKDKNAAAKIKMETTSGGMRLDKVESAGAVRFYGDWLQAERERLAREEAE